MRVLYLIDSLVAGGAETSLAAMAPELVRRGVELEVAHLVDRTDLAPTLEAAGATVLPVVGAGGRPRRTVEVARLVRERRPDLVHTTLFEADVAGRLAAARTRTPVTSSLVNVAYGTSQTVGLRRSRVTAARLVDAATARLVRRFHAVSHAVATEMAARLRIPADRIEVIPRGRDPDALGTRSAQRSREARSRLAVDDAPLLVAVGRQEQQKGFDVLLRAMGHVVDAAPTARLVIAGREGRATPELEGLVRELGLSDNVALLGARDDVHDLLCAADVFVSASRWEGMPGAVIEAMALEAPIVATDIAAVREVVGSEPGARLVRVDDPHDLARAITRSLEEPGGTEALRQRFLDRFTIEVSAARLVDFWARAAA